MSSSESNTGYSITSRDVEGTTHVILRGEIDAALRDQAGEAMVFVVAANSPVVADVADVTFIDSSGLAFLVQLHRLCAESGLDLELRDPSQNILDLLEVLGMAGEFTVQHTEDRETLGAGATTT
ncbi:anti-anti-sigma factor [Sanguibacter gelidistatuariae]|uniref:Anti-anti-sigma factor n=1 Tax=Sanguibacter gelidistatuariae TaxID=1814289 RepID=A0A1G6GZK5_9MICO|nr:STAS domain-containing protein [Sanguibacter gelidistatuariae]SDB87477.1 anti-anti-sigma factor [Sanguibacter gelidistatuariae]